MNYHPKAETVSKLTAHSQMLQNYFLPAIFFVNNKVRGRVSEVRAHYPTAHKSYGQFFNTKLDNLLIQYLTLFTGEVSQDRKEQILQNYEGKRQKD